MASKKTKKTAAKKAPAKAAKKAVAKVAKKAAPKKAAKKAPAKAAKKTKQSSALPIPAANPFVINGRPIMKDPPEKSTIPQYEGSRAELIKEIKEKLLKMKTDTLEAIRVRDEEASVSQEESSTGDEGDMAQALMQQNIQKSLKHNDEGRLRQIDMALEKIAKGTYGICIDTEEDIEPRRLLANPFALRSIQAQGEFEMEQRRSSPSKGGGNAFDEDGGNSGSDGDED